MSKIDKKALELGIRAVVEAYKKGMNQQVIVYDILEEEFLNAYEAAKSAEQASECRAEFEKWATGKYYHPKDGANTTAWEAWQAAWNARATTLINADAQTDYDPVEPPESPTSCGSGQIGNGVASTEINHQSLSHWGMFTVDRLAGTFRRRPPTYGRKPQPEPRHIMDFA